MTSLLFFTDETEVIVVTDTLIADPDENFLGHANKAVWVPRVKLIVAGTGSAEVFIRWIDFLNNESTSFDVDTIDGDATEKLQTIWREVKSDIPALSQQTATIYHFGFSDNTGLLHSYAYRSESGFASTPLDYGLAMKPPLSQADLAGIEYWKFPAQSVAIMRRQASLEQLKPKGSRVLIGGMANVIQLTRAGPKAFTVGELDCSE
ncbi:hypothetical protein [Pseudomonas syringae]|uniref:hypothetical protein n=1 Tax=Pseudomonas syringae TaxID=317 RepID=UPI001010F314|nr:hypothetical protein [Pseudomonas syringae]RXT63034.1 hypothetical protein B1F71_22165 [Pseudomonas syringae]RXT98859.1 hypothetical protein B1F75_00280 [Pseudomonas syringae]